ncbi:AAA family ATPase [Alphaproteobacteria bacterium]|nr:AAA family ATPase [Alphaproteobacteria bacterium]
MTNINIIASKLNKVKWRQTNNSFMACCPIHDDHNPSLSVSQIDGKVLMYCHVCGPVYRNVLEKIGLWEDNREPTFIAIPSPIHAIHDIPNLSGTHWFYRNQFGEILFLIERKDFSNKKKTFIPWSLYQKTNGSYEYKKELPIKKDRPLLNLPELLKCSNIIIVEGEKTVDAVYNFIDFKELNSCAVTTWASGANSVNATDFSILKDKNIYLIPDNDDVGKRAMHLIAEKLDESNKIFFIPEFKDKPEGYDLADEDVHFDLCGLLKNAKELNIKKKNNMELISCEELMKKKFNPISYLVNDLIAEGFTLFAGKPKVGKSWFLLQLSFMITLGQPFLNKECPKGPVIYFSLEDSARRIKSRIELMGYTEIPKDLHFIFTSPKFDNKGIEKLRFLIDRYKPALVIVDTIQKVIDKSKASAKQTSYENQYDQYGAIKDLSDELGVSIIASTHQKKREEDDIYSTINGSMAMQGASDQLIIMAKNNNNEYFTLNTIGRDVLEQELALSRNSQSMQYAFEGEAKLFGENQQRSDVISILKEKREPMTPQEIAFEININATKREINNLTQILNRMYHEGKLNKPSYGKYELLDPQREFDINIFPHEESQNNRPRKKIFNYYE